MRPFTILGGLTALAAAFGAAAGYFALVDMPDLGGLEERVLPEMTRLVDRDFAPLADFAVEKRILLEAHEIPPSFRDALIASEDSRFESHAGVDPVGVLRALWHDARQARLAEGASTLTMQLAGNLFLDRSARTLRRKLQEAFLAMEIERRFSKEEILRMYCNQAHFGHGLYGLEAAARHYFGKPAHELSLAESATLVGILPRPASYSPIRNATLARERRNLVLRRMVEEGHLARERYDALAAEPIVLARRDGPASRAAYFKEDVRRRLEHDYGADALYRGGLTVATTLDPRLQEIAEHAVADGLRRLDERQGRGPGRPPVQAAFVALDPRTGEILAHVGGVDFAASEYDRATLAQRQPGSLFKPFVYAAALARGFTLADTLIDEPTVFVDPSNPVPYQPQNFERDYRGAVTLRTALEDSINVATVKLLAEVGCEAVIETARGLGVKSVLAPYPSLALGAFELTLVEITGAYAAFANGGLYREPHAIRSVTDRDGRTLYSARPEVREALSPQVAYLVVEALAGVVRRGTARAAGEALGRTLAGKTGTTNGYTDAWFVGFGPHLVAGVWVGFDEPESLGDHETGARAALPIWTEFMKGALAGEPDEPFPVPRGIVRVPIDLPTGRRPGVGCSDRGIEVFVAGTEPAITCDAALHVPVTLMPESVVRFDQKTSRQ